MNIPISDAKAQRTELVRRAEAGADIVLIRHGHPVTRLVPVRHIPTTAEKRALFADIMQSGRATTGEDAARSQDSLYDDQAAGLIVVDTSALFAIAAGEARGPACAEALAVETGILISAAILAEALIVASRKGLSAERHSLITGADMEVIPLIEAGAVRLADAYNRWERASTRLA